MTAGPALVSVVIPAYNASATLSETLASVLAQTHRRLEVVVVDDGSADATAELVAAAAARDARVRLVRQVNSGVAAARNRGIAETSGAFVAFVDADDLWAPDKIARQVAALETAGDETGLCYTWFVTIDADGTILHPCWRTPHHGAVLAALCVDNFVGNGSSMLVRRTALDRVGGFDATLRERGAQGCEDYDMLLRVAETHRFALIDAALVGYRTAADSMSNDRARMLLSWHAVVEQTARRRPDLAPLLIQGLIKYAVHLTVGMLLRGRLIAGATVARSAGLPLWRLAPQLARTTATRIVQRVANTVRRAVIAPQQFGDTQRIDAA